MHQVILELTGRRYTHIGRSSASLKHLQITCLSHVGMQIYLTPLPLHDGMSRPYRTGSIWSRELIDAS